MSRISGTFCFLERPESKLSRAWKKIKNSEANNLILTSGDQADHEVIPLSPHRSEATPRKRGFLFVTDHRNLALLKTGTNKN